MMSFVSEVCTASPPPGTGTGAGRISGPMEPPGLKPLPPPQEPPPPPQPGLDKTGAMGLITEGEPGEKRILIP